MRSRTLFAATTVLLVATTAFAGTDFRTRFTRDPLAAAIPASKGCSDSARSVARSCGNEVQAEYWLGIGKCQNVAGAAERAACAGEARDGSLEGREECRDQLDARLEVCDALGEAPYDPAIDPANFVDGIDHPFLPFVPGTVWTYEGETEDGLETIVVEVTSDTREILGVECTVVRDRVYLDGSLIEDTFDWYAQDVVGNVWYFGELSYELEDDVIVSLAGSWEAGVDGARPGIVMPAVPVVGELYRQEFLLGEAEDVAEVTSLAESVSVPYGDFDGCIQTRDWTPIEPDAFELKHYSSGIGMVLETNPENGERVELIDAVFP